MQERGDLYGKLDALFEKRAPDVLVDRALERDDFPELTETVSEAALAASAREAERRGLNRRSTDRRAGDRRQGERRDGAQGDSAAQKDAADVEVDRLLKAMEERLGALFMNQQSHVEDLVRQAIRIELAKQKPD